MPSPRPFDFVNLLYGYRPNWTSLSPITITSQRAVTSLNKNNNNNSNHKYENKKNEAQCKLSIDARIHFMELNNNFNVSANRGGRNRGVNLPSPYFLSQFLPPP